MKETKEINPYELMRFYGKNWLLLVAAIAIGITAGLVYTGFIQQPLYKSSATVIVLGARTSTEDPAINNNYAELFKSRRVLDAVIGQQGYDGTYEQLSAHTTVTNNKNTDIIQFSITDPSPEKSKKLLEASLSLFEKEAASIYKSNEVKIVDEASLPNEPYNVQASTQVLLFTGVTASLTILGIFFAYDYRINGGPLKNKKLSEKEIIAPIQENTTLLNIYDRPKNIPPISTFHRRTKHSTILQASYREKR